MIGLMLLGLLMRFLDYEEMPCRVRPDLTDLNSKVLLHKLYMILISKFRESCDLFKGIAVDSKNICICAFDQLTMKNEMTN